MYNLYSPKNLIDTRLGEWASAHFHPCSKDGSAIHILTTNIFLF